MSHKLDADSYLRTGSNELRVLEYRVGNSTFGINILKVSKIVNKLVDFTKVPESHPAVKGVFKDMDRLVPIVDLAQFLGVYTEPDEVSKVIVTEFFGIVTGFRVSKIDWIHHFQWKDVVDVQKVFADISQKYVIGIVKPSEDRMVQLLDYETILLDVCPELRSDERARQEKIESLTTNFNKRRILIAEDSPAVRAMLVDQMQSLGAEVVESSDGSMAWDLFQQNKFDLVISDVEMPQMDGLALTFRIRQSDRADVPVIVYSSIGDVGMKARAAFLKADAHITKLNMDKLVETAEKLMNGEKLEQAVNEVETPVVGELMNSVPLE